VANERVIIGARQHESLRLKIRDYATYTQLSWPDMRVTEAWGPPRNAQEKTLEGRDLGKLPVSSNGLFKVLWYHRDEKLEAQWIMKIYLRRVPMKIGVTLLAASFIKTWKSESTDAQMHCVLPRTLWRSYERSQEVVVVGSVPTDRKISLSRMQPSIQPMLVQGQAPPHHVFQASRLSSSTRTQGYFSLITQHSPASMFKAFFVAL